MKQVQDYYFKKAKNENYVARSVYKLEEIQNKFNILKKNQLILDLGCFPGSWSQFALKVVGQGGHVIGMDLQKMVQKMESHFTFFQEDIFSIEAVKKNLTGFSVIDVMLSDMAPKTTGIKQSDIAASHDLALQVINLTQDCLKSDGTLVFKYFQGHYFEDIKKAITEEFHQYKIFKPKSSRKESYEIFFVCLNKK